MADMRPEAASRLHRTPGALPAQRSDGAGGGKRFDALKRSPRAESGTTTAQRPDPGPNTVRDALTKALQADDNVAALEPKEHAPGLSTAERRRFQGRLQNARAEAD